MPKFTLTRVRLNSGGCTSNGTYFGAGQPLYYYEAEYPPTWYHLGAARDHDVMGPSRSASHTVAVCNVCGHPVRQEYNGVADYIRADDREHAKWKVKAKYPDATFYR